MREQGKNDKCYLNFLSWQEHCWTPVFDMTDVAKSNCSSGTTTAISWIIDKYEIQCRWMGTNIRTRNDCGHIIIWQCHRSPDNTGYTIICEQLGDYSSNFERSQTLQKTWSAGFWFKLWSEVDCHLRQINLKGIKLNPVDTKYVLVRSKNLLSAPLDVDSWFDFQRFTVIFTNDDRSPSSLRTVGNARLPKHVLRSHQFQEGVIA